jgi:DNA gyrase subunit A
MGRTAAGVTAIRLNKGDFVASMEVIEPGGYLALITRLGYGKRISLDQFPAKRRATAGIAIINKAALQKIGVIASARVVQEADDLTIISTNGVVLRTKVKEISVIGRTARGVRLFNVDPGDSVASMARISDAELRTAGAAE